MGCAQPNRKNVDSSTQLINADIKKEQEQSQETIKILLLGAGESGKSTFAKQIKILHCGGFTEPELYLFKEVIMDNVHSAFYALIDAIEALDSNQFLIKLSEPNRNIFTNFQQIKQTFVVDIDLASKIDLLLSDTNLRNEDFELLEFNDSSLYFLRNISRIASKSYTPTNEDVLRCRAKTSGIQELKFKTADNNNIPLAVVDVGGQRSERRKWVNCFTGITAIIFFVSLSEFDQTLEEESDTNRMCESLKVFDEICNFQCLANIPIILFLNKKDLFESKIKRKKINQAFPEYSGDNSYDDAIKYITEQFLDRNRNSSRAMFNFVTFVADTDQIKNTISAVTDIVIETRLKRG